MPESPAPLFCDKGPEKDFVDYAQKNRFATGKTEKTKKDFHIKNVEKLTYKRSYPHYPHKNECYGQTLWKPERTFVL